MKVLKAQRESMRWYPAMDGTKVEKVEENDPTLQNIKKQKPPVEETLPEATTPETPREDTPATPENGKVDPPTITPTKTKSRVDTALDGYLEGDDASLTREMRRDRDFMAWAVERAQDRLIDEFSERTHTDVRQTIETSGTSDQLHRLNSIDASHHWWLTINTKQTLKQVMSGYYQYRPEIRGWTDQSWSVVHLHAEQKEAVGKFLREVQPDHPYARLTAEHDPYAVSRWNNPFQWETLDPRRHQGIVEFNAQIGAHRPFMEELKHIRTIMKNMKPKKPEEPQVLP